MNPHTKTVLAIFVTAMLVLMALAFELIWSKGRRWLALISISILLLIMVLTIHFASARDLDGRYAQSPLKQWFDSLSSKNGPCCSDADGTALSDVDWEAKDGRYRVRIEGKWYDVPEDALITEPNRYGRTMVWPMYRRDANNEIEHVVIRCFMPGSMT